MFLKVKSYGKRISQLHTMSRYLYLGTALGLVTLFLINIQQCGAVDITWCWSGWAKGKDIMKTMRYTNETKCPENTKYCAKWYLMTGTVKIVYFAI